jgi:DNA-binding Lrp family transcriptional regulator
MKPQSVILNKPIQFALPLDGGRKSKPSQVKRLLDYLLMHGEITTVQAASFLGISNSSCPRRIMDLKDKGYEIDIKTVPHRGMYGKTEISKYILLSKEPVKKDNQ